MMCIGLFTSRVILKQLGVEDYGIWNAVGGVVMIFTMVTDSVSASIHRFLSFELGKKDEEKLKKVFSSGLLVMTGLTVGLLILVTVVGQWFLETKMVIPLERLGAAKVVLYASLGILACSMFSVPFNATIIAHERMGAFALLSIVEAVLKLSVALLLSLGESDKLKLYALLMLGVAIVVRSSYIMYCRRHFGETRGKLRFDKAVLREIMGFAGWSFMGSSANALNTHGLNLLSNVFFGVIVNAARGVASQVDNIVRQFVTNFLTALNPQITKSWAAGDKEYCFELVRKGSKFAMLVVAVFLVPVIAEAETILELWLGIVPEGSALFVSLVLVALFVEVAGNSLMTLQLATGSVKQYYIVTGLSSLLCLPAVWIAFKAGSEAKMAYILLIVFYLVTFVAKLMLVNRNTNFPIAKYIRKVLVPVFAVFGFAILGAMVLDYYLRLGVVIHLIIVCVVSWICIGVSAYFLALTEGEKAYIRQFIVRK